MSTLRDVSPLPADTNPRDIWQNRFDLIKRYNIFALIATLISTIAAVLCAIAVVVGFFDSNNAQTDHAQTDHAQTNHAQTNHAQKLSNFGAGLACLGAMAGFWFQLQTFILPEAHANSSSSEQTTTHAELDRLGKDFQDLREK